VIGPIPGSLPSNVDGTGHTFIGTYLNGSINAPRKIALYVKSAYENLMKNSTCQDYWAVTMDFYSEGYMEVFGSPIVSGHNASVQLSVGKVNFNTYPAKKVGTPPKYVCNGTWLLWGYPDYKATFGDSNLYVQSSDNNPLSWKPGVIYDKDTNERRQKIHYTIRSKNKLTCIELKHEGELYDLVKDTLGY